MLDECEARRRSGQPAPDLKQLGEDYRRHWVQLLEAFISSLRSGRLLANAFRTPLSPHSRRELISPDLWELLDVETDQCRATASGIELIRIEIVLGLNRLNRQETCDEQAEPKATDAKPRPEFEHNEDFTRVRIREHAFELSSQLAKVVQRYYEASLGPDPALPAKAALGELGFRSECLSSVFNRHIAPSWRELLTTGSEPPTPASKATSMPSDGSRKGGKSIIAVNSPPPAPNPFPHGAARRILMGSGSPGVQLFRWAGRSQAGCASAHLPE